MFYPFCILIFVRGDPFIFCVWFFFLTSFLCFPVFTDIRIWKQDNIVMLVEVEDWRGTAANFIEMGMWPKIWGNNSAILLRGLIHIFTPQKKNMHGAVEAMLNLSKCNPLRRYVWNVPLKTPALLFKKKKFQDT